MKIDHLGYAVKRMERALDSFEKLGFCFEQVIDDKARNVQIAFGEKDGYRIELVAPLDKKKETPVDQYLSNVPGTPYHICYSSDDFQNEIDNLKHQGFKIIIEPEPAIAFGGKQVVFMMNLGMGLIEVVEA